MASITPYQTKAGRRWQVQYTKPDGTRSKKRGFTTKAAATAWEQDQGHARRAGAWVDPSRERTTVGEIGGRWLAAQTHLKPSWARTVESNGRLHVEPRWGGRPVGAIRRSEVQEWVSTIGLSGSKVRQIHQVLAQVLDMAIADGCLAVNPARGVTLPRKGKAVKVYLPMARVRALAEACTKHSEILWLLATTGMRWAELAGLQPRDFDLPRRRIHLRRAAVTVGGAVEVGTLKGHENRVIAVPRFVCNMVAPLLEGTADDAWGWQRAGGGPMLLPTSESWFHGALARARAADPGFPEVTIHGLRHVAAGLLVSSGASVKVVQRQLGHASAAMTLDTYADLWDGDLDVVADAMEDLHMSIGAIKSEPKVSHGRDTA